ncbi:MAG: hypothetical protein ACWGOX_05020 [Desulforhopalus sp.]
MKDKTYCKQIDKDIYHDDMEFIKKGRQLHDEAVLKIFFMIVRGLARPFRKHSDGAFKERGFDYPFNNLSAEEK